jgi:hypothetical protein
MPPFITGVSALNFMTRYKLGGIDLSNYEDIGAGIRTLHGSNSTYGNRISAIEYMGNGVILAGTANGTHGRIYKSTDYGANWSTVKTFTNINHVSAIKRYRTSNTVLAATGGHAHDGNVYRSTDAGNTWTLVNDWGGGIYQGHDNVYSLEQFGYIFLHGGGYNEGDGSIWRSADGGQNWVDLRGANSSGHAQTVYYAWDNSSVFDAGSPYYSSSDSWWVGALKHVGNGVVLANRRPVRIGSTSGSGSSTVPELIRSTDYGINWTKVTTQSTNFLNNGQFITENLGGGKVIGVTNAEGSTNSHNANVYISNDYGANWNTTSKFTLNRNRAYAPTHLGNGHVVFLAFHYTGSAFLANGGEVYESLDYGETWNSTPVFDPGVLYLVSAKFNPDRNVLYVGGSLDDTTPVLYKLG